MSPSALYDAAMFTRQGAASPMQLLSSQFSGNLSPYSESSDYHQSPAAKLFASNDASSAPGLAFQTYHQTSPADLPQLSMLDINTPSPAHHPALCSPTSLSIESSTSHMSQPFHDMGTLYPGHAFNSAQDASLVQSFSPQPSLHHPLSNPYHTHQSISPSSSPVPQMVPTGLQSPYPAALSHLAAEPNPFASALIQQQLSTMSPPPEDPRAMSLLFPNNISHLPSPGLHTRIATNMPQIDCGAGHLDQPGGAVHVFVPPPPPPPGRPQFQCPPEPQPARNGSGGSKFASDIENQDPKQLARKDSLVPGRDISLLDYFFNPEFNASAPAVRGSATN